MAIVYPQKPSFNTDGEKYLYDYILSNLPNDWFVFYEPTIQARNPDFILFNKSFGLIVIEVKDYKNETIVSFNPDSWEIQVNGEIIEVTSPIKQVTNYRNLLINYLSTSRLLLDKNTKRFIFPVHTLCVFPNLTYEELNNRGLHRLFTSFNILLKDEISSTESFYKKVEHSRKTLFTPMEYDEQVIEELLSLIYPQEKNTIKGKKTSIKKDISTDKIQRFRTIIDEIVYITDDILHNINFFEYNVNDILIVINHNRLGKYNSYKYKETLIEYLSLKNIPLFGHNGLRFINYEDLYKNPEYINEVKKIYFLDFDSVPKHLQKFFLQLTNYSEVHISAN